MQWRVILLLASAGPVLGWLRTEGVLAGRGEIVEVILAWVVIPISVAGWIAPRTKEYPFGQGYWERLRAVAHAAPLPAEHPYDGCPTRPRQNGQGPGGMDFE